MESNARLLSQRSGSMFVVSRLIYRGASVTTVGDRVVEPTYFYMALYDSATADSAAYLVRNDDQPLNAKVDAATLERLTGVRVFPGVTSRPRDTYLSGLFLRGSKASQY